MQTDAVRVAALALKTAHSGPMEEVASATVEPDGTLVGSASVNPKRGVTFLSSRQWAVVMRELGADLPWHTRRANILIDAEQVGDWRGKTIRIGEAAFEIIAETRPCELMDTFHAGLMNALKPDCRAGVYGRVIHGGLVRVGDAVTVADR